MSEVFFVDTNLLVYCRDQSHVIKQTKATQWLEFLWRSKRGILSIQVLQEYFEICRRKKISESLEQVEEDIRLYYNWNPVTTSTKTMELAFKIRKENNISWWDALIVSTAIEAGSRYLLSEDLGANQVISGVRVIDPFALSPETF